METGQVKWRMDEIDLGRVIERAITVTAALAEEKGLSTRVYLPPDGLPLIYGHRDRLVQVMTNLLSNAIKFTGRGCIEVRGWRLDVDNGALHAAGPAPSVYADKKHPAADKKHPAADKKHPAADKKHPARGSATARSVLSDLQLSEGKWAVVSVADTGIGIPAEALSFIFEKFTQVGETLTEKPKGTGLGLAICKEIVERHGGRIWAGSEEGEGSLFSFALPLPPGDSEEAEYLIENEE
ncbi:MAG: ATP-binding protein [Chloroflexota bacterium]|nr:ATP-binding protein [Chloroflexota bacterium]